jgi:Ran-binding protein 1
LSNEP